MRHEVASEQATAAQAKTTGLWQEELPSIQGGIATPLISKHQVHTGSLAWHELRSSCGRCCCHELIQISWCQLQITLQWPMILAVQWNKAFLPGEKDLSLDGWAENMHPANYMVGNHMKTNPVLTFCVLTIQRNYRLRLISVKFCRQLSSQSL